MGEARSDHGMAGILGALVVHAAHAGGVRHQHGVRQPLLDVRQVVAERLDEQLLQLLHVPRAQAGDVVGQEQEFVLVVGH